MNLLLTSQAGRLDLSDAWTDLEITYGFDPAAQLTIVCRDGSRTLINHPSLDLSAPPPSLDLDGRTWRLQQTAKDGRQVTLTLEDDRVARLRDDDGEFTVTSGTLNAFLRRLAREAAVPVDLVEVANIDEQLSRDDEETSWDAIGRLADVAGARVLMTDTGLAVADDRTLAGRGPQLTFREKSDGVDFIDFVVDARRRAEEVALEVRGTPGTLLPGVDARIAGLRPAAGRWITAQVTWRPHRTATTIDLIRPGAT